MFNIGRVCMKIAGRDAGKRCVIVDVLEGPYVLIDGETRRKKTNIVHLVPTQQVLEITKGASHQTIGALCTTLGWACRTTKPKKAAPRPRTVRKAPRRSKKVPPVVKKSVEAVETKVAA